MAGTSGQQVSSLFDELEMNHGTHVKLETIGCVGGNEKGSRWSGLECGNSWESEIPRKAKVALQLMQIKASGLLTDVENKTWCYI